MAAWETRTKALRGDEMLCHLIPVVWDPVGQVLLMPKATPLLTWATADHTEAEWASVVSAVNRTLEDVIVCCQVHKAVAPDIKVANLAVVECAEGLDVKVLDVDSIDVSAEVPTARAIDHTYTCAELRALWASKKGANRSASNEAYTAFSAAVTMLELAALCVTKLRSSQLVAVSAANLQASARHVVSPFLRSRLALPPQRTEAKIAASARTWSALKFLPGYKKLQNWPLVARVAVAAARSCLVDGTRPFEHPQLGSFPLNLNVAEAAVARATAAPGRLTKWVCADGFACTVALAGGDVLLKVMLNKTDALTLRVANGTLRRLSGSMSIASLDGVAINTG